jgi:DNA-binding PadR family transcriptional regulator
MSLKYGLLGLLNYGKMSGYDLDKAFKDSLAFFGKGKPAKFTGNLPRWKNRGG